MTLAYRPGIEPVAWLYGQVAPHSTYPGYRSIRLDSLTRTVTSNTPLDAWALLTVLDAALSSDSWDVTVNNSTFSIGRPGVTKVVTWPDRLGWLLGFDAEPGDVEVPTDILIPRAAPPLMVPLLSIEPQVHEREAERKITRRRHGQGAGFAFGDAEVHRFRVLLDRVGLDALNAGWVLCGDVVFSPYTLAEHIDHTAVPYGPENPWGFRRGRVLDITAGTWLDSDGRHDLYRCTLTLALEPVYG